MKAGWALSTKPVTLIWTDSSPSKCCRQRKSADPERKRRFVQEAKAASALNHPNIITIHDIASENGIDFIVMEYVEGKTLDRLIPRKGLRLNEVLEVRHPDCRRAGKSPLSRHHPSRPETDQCDGDRRRVGEGARLRSGETD